MDKNHSLESLPGKRGTRHEPFAFFLSCLQTMGTVCEHARSLVFFGHLQFISMMCFAKVVHVGDGASGGFMEMFALGDFPLVH